jgi:alkylation response protein AidB-like acyl-CoA dehydrogenase
LRTERARALVALVAVRTRSGEATPGDVAAARLLALEAAGVNGKDAVLLHGGMGFTWECPAHLFLRRARHLQFSRPAGPETYAAILGEGALDSAT